MEQNDGCVVQLLYAGAPDVQIDLAGTVVGQPQPAQLRFSGSISSPADQYEKLKKESRAGGYSLIFISVFLTLVTGGMWAMGRPPEKKSILLVLLLIFALGVLLLYASGGSEPPFGFR